MSCVLKPMALAFGEQALFTSRTVSFSLRNSGVVALPIVSMELRGTDRALFSLTHTCGTSVAMGETCAINVTFRPTTVGAKSAKLRVNAGGHISRTRLLTGTGVNAKP